MSAWLVQTESHSEQTQKVACSPRAADAGRTSSCSHLGHIGHDGSLGTTENGREEHRIGSDALVESAGGIVQRCGLDRVVSPGFRLGLNVDGDQHRALRRTVDPELWKYLR